MAAAPKSAAIRQQVRVTASEIPGLELAASPRWNVSRMPKVDLTILRLAAWEILHEEDVPGSVAINEAVELAKKYDDPKARAFINGVLNAIKKELEELEAKYDIPNE